jgi:hypothetical protein
VSIQGANEDAHVATTGRPDSFRRILHGLAELQRRGQTVTANMCVNTLELSARSRVSGPAREVRRPPVARRRRSSDSIGDRDEVYLREIMPRYSDMAPYYAAMLEGFERQNPDFDVNVGNLPYCIPAGVGIAHSSRRRDHGHPRHRLVTGSNKVFDKYDWHESLRTHLPGCADCVFRSSCTASSGLSRDPRRRRVHPCRARRCARSIRTPQSRAADRAAAGVAEGGDAGDSFPRRGI